MAIFPNLEIESTLQVNDKTRIDATKSFISKGEAVVGLVRIEPESGAGFKTVTGTKSSDWFLDWAFATAGNKTVTVEITTDGSPVTKTGTINVLTAANDKLFSKDSDLVQHEHDILKYIRAGRNSYLDIHRRAQERILAYLDENGYTDDNGNKITLDKIVDVSEFTEWSKFLTLNLIFSGISNSVDDIFEQKAKHYESKMLEARSKLRYRTDLDGSGTVGDGEQFIHNAPRLIRI